MFDALEFPYALFLIPLFVFLELRRSRQHASFYMPHISYLSQNQKPLSRWYAITKWVMILSLIIASALPYTMKELPLPKKKSIDIVLALDISGSMGLYGFNPNHYRQTRLSVVQDVVSNFIATRIDDRVGLVVFGTHSSIASPLSFDKEAQLRIVKGLRIGALGKSTALIDSIVSSAQLLKESHNPSKIIILLSDGEDSSSQIPLSIALKLRKKYGIKIYTIIIDKSASNMMQTIAKDSQTTPYNPKDKKALEAVYTKINHLEKGLQTQSLRKVSEPRYGYFLSLSLLCALILLATNRLKEVF